MNIKNNKFRQIDFFLTSAALVSHCTEVDPVAWNPFNHIHSARQHRGWHLWQPWPSTSVSSSLRIQTGTQTEPRTRALIYLPFHELCLLFSSFLFIFSRRAASWAQHKKEGKKEPTMFRTTLWRGRKLLFVLSLIESLLLFIGARQPGQQGRQSYADHIEGLHYLEASYFLFSLKGRARESISLAKESDGEQKLGRVWVGVWMRGREGVSYKESASLRAPQGNRHKLHLNSIFTTVRWLYANTARVHFYALVCDLHVCLGFTCVNMHSVFLHVCLHVPEKNQAPGGSKGLILLYLNRWLMMLHT